MPQKQLKRRIRLEPNRLTREAAYFAWKFGMSTEEALKILVKGSVRFQDIKKKPAK
jgi:hypothetical protein